MLYNKSDNGIFAADKPFGKELDFANEKLMELEQMKVNFYPLYLMN